MSYKKQQYTQSILLQNTHYTMSMRITHCGNCGLAGHNRRTCKVDVRSRRKVKRKPSISLKSKKRVVKCGSCGEKGHNKKTCKHIAMLKPSSPRQQPKYELCPICMDDCKGKTCTLECGHTFHTKCIFTWFKKNNNCPCCRAEVPEMKKAVDTPTINLPSPAFMGAMMRMVDDSLASENAPIRIEDMTPQRYVESVMVFTHMTLTGLSDERRRELSQMEGSIGGW